MQLASAESVDATRVAPKLWVGSVPYYDTRIFDVVVLCAGEFQHVDPRTPVVIHAPLRDAELREREFVEAIRAARAVSSARRRGARVLVTCAMGINRSSFVAALSMIMLDKLSASDVIRKIRQTRGQHTSMMPLSNPSFVRALRRFEQL